MVDESTLLFYHSSPSSLRWLDQGSQFTESLVTHSLTRQDELSQWLSHWECQIGTWSIQPRAINTRASVIITTTQLYLLSMYYVSWLCWVFKNKEHLLSRDHHSKYLQRLSRQHKSVNWAVQDNKGWWGLWQSRKPTCSCLKTVCGIIKNNICSLSTVPGS